MTEGYGDPLADPMVGRVVLNRYRVMRVLALGGMGVLYLGRTEGAAGFFRPVVIKRILPHLITNPRMAGLFAREARILSELQHQNIVSILDFGEEDGAYIMVLEYVRGFDLGLWHRYLCEVGRLFTGDVALQIMIRVLEALHYAHTFQRPDGRPLNIVHRDVSPGNVLLDTEGHVKLLDFGIARFSDDGGEYRTRTGEFKGKAAYTPPEVFAGQSASAQADIFSSAVVLYKILAGFNPFEGENSAQTMKRIVDLDPQPLSRIRPDLDKRLDHVLARGLAKQPHDRFETAAEFADALRACRYQSDELANVSLISELRYDFLGKMPERLGLESLPALDAAWRLGNTDAEGASAEVRSAAPPAVDNQTNVALHSTMRRRSLAITLGVTTIAVAALGVGVFSLVRSQRNVAQGPSFVVVQPNEAATNAGVTAAPAGAGTQTGDTESDSGNPSNPDETTLPEPMVKTRTGPPPRTNPRSTSVEPDAVALTRSFRRHQAQIERCFVENAESVHGQPEVAIQFQIDATGVVQNADTVPATLGTTALGDCLLGIARKTRFGTQPHAVSFRIPLRARQSGTDPQR